MRINGHIADLNEFAKLRELIRAGKTPCSIFGVAQSLKPLLAAALAEEENKTVIVVCSSQERAAQYAAADEQGVFIPKRALFLRSSVARSRETAFQRISAIVITSYSIHYTKLYDRQLVLKFFNILHEEL